MRVVAQLGDLRRLTEGALGHDREEERFVFVLRRDPCAYCGQPGGTADHIVPRHGKRRPRSVKLEGTIHCEGPDCETHSHVGADTVRAGRLPVGWLRVIEHSSGNGDHETAVCSWDCLMKLAATFEPPTIIPAGGSDG